MKRKQIVVSALLAVGFSTVAPTALCGTASEDATREEHIAWGETAFPDPTLWKAADGRYYAYATPSQVLTDQHYLESDDGLVWRQMDYGPFTPEMAAAIQKDWKRVWAPDHAVVAGKRLLYVALYNSAKDSAIAACRLDGEPGRVTDFTIITRSSETGIRDSIDPEVVTDPETGRVWLFFGSTGKMHRVELAADGMSVKPGAKYEHVAGRPGAGKGRSALFEGAYLHRRGAWWYLFVSAGWHGNATYNIRVGRSPTLDGVFVDREGRPMTEGHSTPVLGTDGDFYGPGHNGDFLVAKDGVERIYYHCHKKGHKVKGKEVRILLCRRLVWDADGWPTAVK